VVDHLVDLVRNQQAGRDHCQILRPPAPHRQAHALSAFEQRVCDGSDGHDIDVAEVTDEDEDAQEQLHDDAVAGREVELVLRVVGPHREPSLLAGDDEADGQGDQDDCLDDALDDDDLDERVVFTAHAAELSPQSREVVRPARGRLIHRRDLNKLGCQGS